VPYRLTLACAEFAATYVRRTARYGSATGLFPQTVFGGRISRLWVYAGFSPDHGAGVSSIPDSTKSREKRFVAPRWTYAVLLLALAFVLMPYLLWNATWFGKPLTDGQISKALGDHAHARKIQHALAQIESRMEKGDPMARQWYPTLVNLAADDRYEIRLTDAWVMGQDPTVPEFHPVLQKLLSDPNSMVQRNAALSLVRFQDASGRPLILSMLQPYPLTAPVAGKLKARLKPGDVLNPGTLVGKIETAGESREVRSEVPGTLQNWASADGSSVSPGQTILLISPSPEMAWEALRALYLIGEPTDIPQIAPYARGVEGMPPQVKQQASLAIDSIRLRAEAANR
jgi:biotin carboxyl carrier protein